MTETLPRMKFTQVDESLADTRVQLAMDAKSKLGYDRLALAIATPSALMFALRKLDIQPLVKSSVEAYMAEKAKPGMWSGRKDGAWLLGITSMACLTLGPLFIRWANSNGDVFSWTGLAGVIGCLLLVIASVLFTVFGLNGLYNKDWRGSRTTRKWVSADLKIYSGNVPEYALDRALRIKTEVPDATFSVVQLHEETERIVRPMPDPFLVVNLGSESYYVDVWDEKEYEAKL